MRVALAVGAGLAGVAGLGLLVSCVTQSRVPPADGARPVVGAASSAATGSANEAAPVAAAASTSAPISTKSVTPATAPIAIHLPAPGPVRSWTELRHQAALRLMAANPQTTYVDEVPDVLLAIPVLEIELNGDGSIRRIEVLRKPGQALDTVQLATDALRRAAPFGDVSHLPKPWRFTETFLFDAERRFKPRTLD